MTPIRVLFFLAAVTAACAGRIPAEVRDIDSLETRIALLARTELSATHLAGNPVNDAIQKIEELVRKIKERIALVESVVADALANGSLEVVKKINDFINAKLGIDLGLDKKWEAQEKKTAACNAQMQVSLKDIINEIKADTETCAATELADIKEIAAKLRDLVVLLETVPIESIQKIKACNNPATEAPTDAPATVTPATDAPATEAPETEAPVSVQGRKLHGISDAWRIAKCVTKELAVAAKELSDVPEIIAKLVSDVADLSSKKTREELAKCAQQGIAGKGDRIQTVVAELAYCIIAPSQQ